MIYEGKLNLTFTLNGHRLYIHLKGNPDKMKDDIVGNLVQVKVEL